MKKLLLLLSFIYVAQVNAQCPITVSGSATICVGGSTTFTASGATTYTWAPATSLDNANIANPTASPTTTTIYTVTATTGTCITSGTTTVTVNSLPSYTLAGNAFTICNGGQQTFNVSGASSYTWTPVATLDNGNIVNPTANPTTTTVYSVTGTDANACTNLTPATVTVNVVPAPSLSVAANSYTICEGSSQMLSASGASTYTWVPAATLSNPNIANPVALPLTTTIYTVYGTASGCAPSAPLTVTLTVNPTPTLSIAPLGSNSVVCNGASVVITPSGATTYTLNPGNITGTSFTVSPSTPTTYTINGTDGATACSNNPADAAVFSLVANPSPIITYTLVQDVAPHTWDLFYTTTGGSQPYNYTFNWGDGSSSNVAYPTHTYSVAGTYSICATVVDNFGCSSTICQNDAVFRLGNNSTYSSMVNLNVKSGTPGALAYQKLLADSITEFDVNVSCPGVLSNGNPQPLSNCVNVNLFMQSTWYAKGDSLYNGKAYKKIKYNGNFQGLMREDTAAKKVYFIQYCNTTEDLLYDFSLTQGSTINYNFTNTNPYMPNGVYTVDSVKLQHDYKTYYHKHFYLRNHGSVNNKTLEMVEGVGNVSHPLFLYYNFSTAIILTPSSECTASNFNEALGCKWNNGTKVYIDSTLFKMATSPPYGNYFNDSCNYCLGQTGGINKYNNLETVSIYPNPAQNNFTVETNATEKQTLQLFDVNGRLVLAQTINEKTIIDAGNLNAGVYSLSIISKEAVVTKKIIIVK
jgi:hypothetical protein